TVLPMHRAPAANNCSTHTAWTAAGGCVSRQVGLPQPVGLSATSIKSLTAKVSPVSGPSAVGGRSEVWTNAPLCSAVIDRLEFIEPSLWRQWRHGDWNGNGREVWVDRHKRDEFDVSGNTLQRGLIASSGPAQLSAVRRRVPLDLLTL